MRTDDEIIEIVNDFNYMLLDKYRKNGKLRVIVETLEGYKADVSFSDLMVGNGRFNLFDISNPYTLKNISLWLQLNDKDFKLDENNFYIKAKNKLKFYCYKCENYFICSWAQIQSGQNCAVCSGKQIAETTSLAYLRPDLIEEWSSRNRISPSNITLHSDKNIFWKCKVCEYEWNAKVNDRSKGNGCPSCSGRVASDKNRLSITNPSIAAEWHPIKNNNLTSKDVSFGSDKKVWWLCSKCSNEWFAQIHGRVNGSGCPKCALLQIESKVATQLKEYILKNYNAETEYKILRNSKTNYYLPFDIYIHNNIYIEIHGIQHYKFSTLFYKNQEEFKYRQYLDLIKKEFAEQNGIYIEIDLRKIKNVEDAIQYIENILINGNLK